MINLLSITTLILISNIQATNKLECVIQHLGKELNIPYDIKQHIALRINEQNFNNKYAEDSNKIYEELLPIDFSTAHQIEEMLRDFKSQAHEFQVAVEKCNLSMKSTMALCERKFKHCELIDKFTVAAACPDKYVRFNYANCVPECDIELQAVDGDVFVCAKSQKSTRSAEITTIHPRAILNYKDVLQVVKCPAEFTQLNNDICIANCPYGWEDLGTKCLKPYFEKREFELFSYSFHNDSTAVKEDDM